MIDFDGVIHSYVSKWQGADVIPDPPVPGAIDFIREALNHFDVQIFSSRSNQPGGIEAMKEYLDYHTDGDLLYDVKFPTEKPPAFLTIDDRAITFNGTWPRIEDLKAFKPWNK